MRIVFTEKISNFENNFPEHYGDVIMDTIASQITSLAIVYSTVYSDADQRKHQSSASLAFARGIHRWPVNSPHKWPVTRKMFPFDDVIMSFYLRVQLTVRQHLFRWWLGATTSHYLGQYWPISMSLYGVTAPQGLKWRWPCEHFGIKSYLAGKIPFCWPSLGFHKTRPEGCIFTPWAKMYTESYLDSSGVLMLMHTNTLQKQWVKARFTNTYGVSPLRTLYQLSTQCNTVGIATVFKGII